MKNIKIQHLNQKLVGGELISHEGTFGAFLRMINGSLEKYHQFVSSENQSVLYKRKDFNMIRRSFKQLHSFEQNGGRRVYHSYRDGAFWLEVWQINDDAGEFFELKRFQYLPVDEFLMFVDNRHILDEVTVVDNISQFFDLNNQSIY